MNKKIYILNVITFLTLLVGFLFLHYHLQAINYEYSYLNYKDNPFNENIETETLKIKPILVIITSINLILLLNTLYFLIKYREIISD